MFKKNQIVINQAPGMKSGTAGKVVEILSDGSLILKSLKRGGGKWVADPSYCRSFN